jgi:ADP-ribose pyrophosphatase YjhB (NUDIX family)
VSTRPELCVGAVVLRGQELLLVRRARGPGFGRWSLPGGRVEVGETLAEAVVREVAEETGLEVVCGEALGWVERISDRDHFVIIDFRAVPTAPGAPLTAGDDAAEVAWVPLDEVTGMDLVDGLAEFLADHGVVRLIT